MGTNPFTGLTRVHNSWSQERSGTLLHTLVLSRGIAIFHAGCSSHSLQGGTTQGNMHHECSSEFVQPLKQVHGRAQSW